MKDLDDLRADYVVWHKMQVDSGDIDPMYPVLRSLADQWGLDNEDRAWLVFCHVIWYHPGSTLVGFEECPTVGSLPRTEKECRKSRLLELPCLTERRGHRPKQPLINHLLDLRKTLTNEGGAWTWVQNSIVETDDPEEKWVFLNEELLKIVGNGRWAAYKTAEMLQKVCDLPIVAPDAGHRYSSGPRKGLEILEPKLCPSGNRPDDIAVLDMLTEKWAVHLGEPDIAQVETSLCDFNSLVHGRYYIGHDIDSMEDSWVKFGHKIPVEAWMARAEVFDPKFLAEQNDWSGVRKTLKTHYARTGELTWD